MRIALLTDTHWGVRNDNPAFIEFFRDFYELLFFPTLQEEGISTVVMLGDTFDRRKYTNHTTMKAAKEIYFDKLEEAGIDAYVLVGNHDTAYKNTLHTNSASLLLSSYSNITVIDAPRIIAFDDLPVCFIPWICDDNEEDCVQMIESTTAEICMGHLEIDGFEMYLGMPGRGGLSPSVFKHFDKVYSGHYHHRSLKSNIQYLGTSYEMTWNDFADPKGFHIFDTDTREITFIENPRKMFVKIVYNDANQQEWDFSEFRKKYVKVMVVGKNDCKAFDTFIENLESAGCHDVKIIEDMHEFESVEDLDDSVNLENTQGTLLKYIDALETDFDKEKIKNFITELYLESLVAEDT